MSDEPNHIAALRQAYAAYATGDPQPMIDLMADNVRFGLKGPREAFRFAGIREGKDWVKRVLREIAEDYEWLEYGLRRLIFQGDGAVAFTGGRLRHRASGRAFAIDLIDAMRFENGKLVELTEHADTAELVAKQGMPREHLRLGASRQAAAKPKRAAKRASPKRAALRR